MARLRSIHNQKLTGVRTSAHFQIVLIERGCCLTGHVNPIGPRACYDEGKRVAEALTYGYQRQDGVDVRVARIFNTFGPRMSSNEFVRLLPLISLSKV